MEREAPDKVIEYFYIKLQTCLPHEHKGETSGDVTNENCRTGSVIVILIV